MPPIREAVPLGLQHVLAMFVGNVTVPLIIAAAINLPEAETIFFVQVTMFVAGIATLIQSLGIGPIGARMPIVMGTSFGFVPVLIPVAQTHGLAAVFGAAFVGGLTMALVGLFIRHIRFLFPPVVTGSFVLMIGLLMIPVGFAHAGGGFGAEDFGAARHIGLATFVFLITLSLHQYGRGFVSEMSILLGIAIGYVASIPLGLLQFGGVEKAGWFQFPMPLQFGLEFVPAAIAGVVVMAIVTCAESIGDIAGTVNGGCDREPTDKELSGGVMADGLATSFAAFFGALPQISFSQNVGLVAFTGVASRYVVAIGGGFLILAGLLPKLGALITTIPDAVLGGAVIIMFGLIASAGIKMLAAVELNKRNLLIIGLSLSAAIGLREQQALYANVSPGLQAILASGLVPGAIISIGLNLVLPGRVKE